MKQIETQDQLNAARRECSTALKAYHSRISRELNIRVGSSVVRELRFFEDNHFAIEQRITICMRPQEGSKGWVGK